MEKNIQEVNDALILGLKDYFAKNNFKKAVIGLSGGLDSTVAAYLTVKALGNKNVLGILLPDSVTSKESLKDAISVAKKLKIKYQTLKINDFNNLIKSINKNNKIKNNNYVIANYKARVRMLILFYFANLNDALVIGTSDKSEIALGYTTKFGDNASDIMVLGDLWKTEVIELGKFLKIPKNIITKKPSAELIPGLYAEKELGAKYEVLDKILKMYIEEKMLLNEIIKKGFDKKIVQNAIKKLNINEHKRKMPMILRVSERSFHNSEWRYPITNKFSG